MKEIAMPRPDIRGMSHALTVAVMAEWFLSNFEDPVHRTPWDEGEYVFIWGGPYNAYEEITNAFGDVATEQAIAAAVSLVEGDGTIQWVPREQCVDDEDLAAEE
jgi:hypothetical protein